MDLASFESLFSDDGRAALDAAVGRRPDEASFLRDFQHLSRQFSSDMARAALEIAIARGRARAKFGDAAEQLFFTREALEQASADVVSVHRAVRFDGRGHVLDLACGAGADTMALASLCRVTGIDLDALRVAMASRNATAAGVAGQAGFIVGDVTRLPVQLSHADAIFFDPARRSNERRAKSVSRYDPPLSVIRDWRDECPDVAVKLSPAVRVGELVEFNEMELEFVSVDGELKETTMWLGGFPANGVTRRATLLPGGESLTDDVATPQIATGEPGGYLYEPDAAVMRAGLVTRVAADIGGHMLDPDIAFFTADERVETPFARSWPIEDWMPFNLKKLRAYFRERNVGRVTIKKRGSPVDVPSFTRDLKLNGDEERTLALTHLNGRPIAIIALS